MIQYLDTILAALSYLSCAFILFFIGKFVYKLFHPSIDVKDELVEKDNFAFATAHTGYFIGLLLALGATIIGDSQGLVNDLINIAIYGGLSILLLNISILINDKIILSHFSVRKEICEDKNAGTGVVEAASAIAAGLIIMGSVMGEGSWITAVVYWAIGQVLIIISAWFYNLILPYNIHDEIEKDNVAVGVGFAGAIVAVANLIRFALANDFESWTDTFTYIGIDYAIAIVLLPVARFLADRILLPGQKLTDELVHQEKPNVGAALIEAFSYIGVSVLITWCM